MVFQLIHHPATLKTLGTLTIKETRNTAFLCLPSTFNINNNIFGAVYLHRDSVARQECFHHKNDS